jgi:hypothetical protein
LVGELNSILAALEWRDSPEGGFPHASREVILKLTTKLSLLRECNGKSTSSDDEIYRRVVAAGIGAKTREQKGIGF